MHLSVIGRQIDISEAFRSHVGHALSAILSKYFGDAIDAAVTISREAHLYRAVIVAHIGRGMDLQAVGEAEQAYDAFDLGAERLAKRLRRYKRRLRDHHRTDDESKWQQARQLVIAGSDSGESEVDVNGEPVVVAEMTTSIAELTVGEAVMRLDLAELPALLFRNRAHRGLNMVYRRSDGNIGWVDPEGSAAGEESPAGR